MFTGIVTHIGEVAEVREMDGGRELVVASDAASGRAARRAPRFATTGSA